VSGKPAVRQIVEPQLTHQSVTDVPKTSYTTFGEMSAVANTAHLSTNTNTNSSTKNNTRGSAASRRDAFPFDDFDELSSDDFDEDYSSSNNNTTKQRNNSKEMTFTAAVPAAPPPPASATAPTAAPTAPPAAIQEAVRPSKTARREGNQQQQPQQTPSSSSKGSVSPTKRKVGSTTLESSEERRSGHQKRAPSNKNRSRSPRAAHVEDALATTEEVLFRTLVESNQTLIASKNMKERQEACGLIRELVKTISTIQECRNKQLYQQQ